MPRQAWRGGIMQKSRHEHEISIGDQRRGNCQNPGARELVAVRSRFHRQEEELVLDLHHA